MCDTKDGWVNTEMIIVVPGIIMRMVKWLQAGEI